MFILDMLSWIRNLLWGNTSISGIDQSYAQITNNGVTFGELMILTIIWAFTTVVVSYLTYKVGRLSPIPYKLTPEYQAMSLEERRFGLMKKGKLDGNNNGNNCVVANGVDNEQYRVD